MIVTYATKITRENIPAIVADAAKWNLNVDYLEGVLEEAEEFGEESYAILSVNYEFRHAVFSEMWGTDFANNWMFTGQTHGAYWKNVKLKTEAR